MIQEGLVMLCSFVYEFIVRIAILELAFAFRYAAHTHTSVVCSDKVAWVIGQIHLLSRAVLVRPTKLYLARRRCIAYL